MFSLGEAIFKIHCNMGQRFTVQINLYHTIYKPGKINKHLVSAVYLCKMFVTFYKSYRKMYKVEETDFMFHYSGTSSDVWNVICFCMVWDNNEICICSPFSMKNTPLVYTVQCLTNP